MPYANEPTYSKNNPQSLKDAIGIHSGIEKKVRGNKNGEGETAHTGREASPHKDSTLPPIVP